MLLPYAVMHAHIALRVYSYVCIYFCLCIFRENHGHHGHLIDIAGKNRAHLVPNMGVNAQRFGQLTRGGGPC